MSQHRNIILICLDSVRKDSFDKYSKRIQKKSDVSFPQCRSASSWSVPSHASMLTGQLPHKHGVHYYNNDFTSISRRDTFLSDLDNYTKLCVSANAFASHNYGFDKFFDDSVYLPKSKYFEGLGVEEFFHEYSGGLGAKIYLEYIKKCISSERPLNSALNGLIYKLEDITEKLPIESISDDGASKILRAARAQIKNTNQPIFQFINLMDAHGPFHAHSGLNDQMYDASPGWTSGGLSFEDIVVRENHQQYKKDIKNYRELYDASIEYLDRQVSNYIDFCQKNIDGELTVIITADHGEGLMLNDEEKILGHKSSLIEGLLHVPLEIVNAPEGYKDTEDQYFSHTELGELIRCISRGNVMEMSNDKIAAERIGSQGINSDDISDEDKKYWKRMIRVVYSGSTKIEWDSVSTCNRYSLDAESPCNQEFITQLDSPPKWCSRFFNQSIEEYLKSVDNRNEIAADELTRSRLEDLGYV